MVAHSVALALQGAGDHVPGLVMFEDAALREAADMASQPWYASVSFE